MQQITISQVEKHSLISEDSSEQNTVTGRLAVLQRECHSEQKQAFGIALSLSMHSEYCSLRGRLGAGVVALALLAGGSFVVPRAVVAQSWGVAETVLIIDAIGRIKLRILQSRDQPLILVPELPSHQSGLTHHHHVLQGTARGANIIPVTRGRVFQGWRRLGSFWHRPFPTPTSEVSKTSELKPCAPTVIKKGSTVRQPQKL